MKILGARVSAITMANQIQPREYSRGGGPDGRAHERVDSDGYSNVLKVSHDDVGRWLNGDDVNPDDRWNLENIVVFGVPRQSLHFSRGLVSGEFCFTI